MIYFYRTESQQHSSPTIKQSKHRKDKLGLNVDVNRLTACETSGRLMIKLVLFIANHREAAVFSFLVVRSEKQCSVCVCRTLRRKPGKLFLKLCMTTTAQELMSKRHWLTMWLPSTGKTQTCGGHCRWCGNTKILNWTFRVRISTNSVGAWIQSWNYTQQLLWTLMLVFLSFYIIYVLTGTFDVWWITL